jgi:hypothetical protein
MLLTEELEGQRMNPTRGMTPGAEPVKLPSANGALVDRRFGHDRSCGIAGAEKQHVERLTHTDLPW